VLAASFLWTSLSPCPRPVQGAGDAAAHWAGSGPGHPHGALHVHASHPQNDSRAGEGEPDSVPPTVSAPCPCGCGGGTPTAASPRGAGQKALLTDAFALAAPDATAPLSAVPARVSSASPRAIDHVPIA
jgi:hypothetical protein